MTLIANLKLQVTSINNIWKKESIEHKAKNQQTKLQEPKILHIQTLRCYCPQLMSPVALPFVRIVRVSFIYKDNKNIINKTTWPLLEKCSNKCCCIRLCSVAGMLSYGNFYYYLCYYSIDSRTYIWQFAFIASKQIYNAFTIAVKTMITLFLLTVSWRETLISKLGK